MDAMSDLFEDLPDGAFQQAMQDAIEAENGWNAQNDDVLDAYEGYVFWETEKND